MSAVKRVIAPFAFVAALLAVPAWSAVVQETTTVVAGDQSDVAPQCISCWQF